MINLNDLKVIRLALSKYPISHDVLNAITNVDSELAKHNLKAVYKSKPKRPYQRRADGGYVFEQINVVNNE